MAITLPRGAGSGASTSTSWRRCIFELRELLLRLARVVGSALDHEAAHTLRPGQGDVLGDVKQVAPVAREDDVLLVGDEPGLGQVGRAQAGQLGKPLQHTSGDGFQVAALGRSLLDELARGRRHAKYGINVGTEPYRVRVAPAEGGCG